MSTAPISDPNSMPMDQLHAQVSAQSDPPPAPPAEPVAAPAVAAPAPPPEPYQIQAQQDGSFYVKLDTGEEFRGKPEEILPKLAKSKYDSSAYAKQLKSQLDAHPASPAQSTPATPAPLSPEEQAQVEARRWLVDTLKSDPAAAKEIINAALGIPVDNLVETSRQMTINANVAEFHRMCPDYVDTPENIKAMESYFENVDHFPTAHELRNAWAMAIYEKKVSVAPPAPPLNRPPVPMPGVTTSDPGGQNPWTTSMDDLARQAGLK